MKEVTTVVIVVAISCGLLHAHPVKHSGNHGSDESGVCGYLSCPGIDSDALNIHLVPHSHDDVGWLKTVDQYYFGAKNTIQKAGVQYIIDSVVEELSKDPSKKFIYVETAFLWKWWLEQDEETQSRMSHLINNGQMEIISGGWSMNDEAATHYHSIVDQFTWGHRRLNDTFGPCSRPKIGWQIDPFGHSREMASIMAQMNFDGLFLGRVDYQDKSKRLGSKTAEMIWSGSPNSLGTSADLFTGVLFNNYSPPPGFCFDILCQDEPIVNDKSSPQYNIKERVASLLKYAETQSSKYKTNNVLLTMGEDFNYQDAHMWYKNLDKLIAYVKKLRTEENVKVNMFYSTPSCYLNAVHESNETWPTKTDDFFPYASDPHAYWTGYFSSRPTIKYYERVGNQRLQVCKQLATHLPKSQDTDLKGLVQLREAMGVMQHHDAVTGTEKQHVAADYSRLLTQAIDACTNISQEAVNLLLQSKVPQPSPRLPLIDCPLLNISQCEATENLEKFAVLVYNPSSQTYSPYIRLPVPGSSYNVLAPNGSSIVSQIVPISSAFQNIPGRVSLATNDLVFRADSIKLLGYKVFYVEKAADGSGTSEKSQLMDAQDDASIGNDLIQVRLHKGKMIGLVTPSHFIPMSNEFKIYTSATGNNEEFKNRSSGAYIFRPDSESAIEIDAKINKLTRGPVIDSVDVTFKNWISETIRVYKQESFVELDWVVGPIPIADGKGKEIVSQFTTSLNSNSTFFTDSNGREMLERTRNYRPTWDLDVSEPVASNYYPVTSRIAIQDSTQNIRVALITDRAQGGASLKDGQLELMVHRRILHDDAFGVAEALNETAFGQGLVARGSHYVTVSPQNGKEGISTAGERLLAQRLILSPWLSFIDATNLSFEEMREKYVLEFNGVSEDIPENIQVLTYEPWKDGTRLLRLEHLIEKGVDKVLSQPVCVNIKKILSNDDFSRFQETTLSANQLVGEYPRLKWKKLQEDKRKRNINLNTIDQTESQLKKSTCNGDPFDVTLDPMQIRTFVLS